MAKRRKLQIIGVVAQLLCTVIVISIGLRSDISSPGIFLFKAAYLPIVLVCIVTFFSSFIVVRTYYYLAVCVVLSLLLLITLLPNTTQSDAFSKRADDEGFSVATFSAMTRSNNANDILDFVRTYNPDVLCLQEVKEIDIEGLKKSYPYQSKIVDGLIVFSQFPLKEGDRGIGIQSIELQVQQFLEERTVTLLNVHMPRQYRDQQKLLLAINDLHNMTKQTDHSILCGDFNLSPRNTMYSHIVQQLGFDDAQNNQMFEYGFTFPNANRRLATLGVWLRIDYLFSKGFYSGTTRVVDVSKLSDHRAVMSTFLMMEK